MPIAQKSESQESTQRGSQQIEAGEVGDGFDNQLLVEFKLPLN